MEISSRTYEILGKVRISRRAFFFVLYPVVAEIFGLISMINPSTNQVILIILGVMIILSIFGGFYFFWVLIKKICPNCVNFSCPLNQVPKEIVDKYLMKNPVMKEAWESTGYVIGKTSD